MHSIHSLMLRWYAMHDRKRKNIIWILESIVTIIAVNKIYNNNNGHIVKKKTKTNQTQCEAHQCNFQAIHTKQK